MEKEGGIFYFFMHRTFHNTGKRKILIVKEFSFKKNNYEKDSHKSTRNLWRISPGELVEEIIKIYKDSKELNFYETKLISGGGRIV